MAAEVPGARSFYLAMRGNLLGRPYVLTFALPAICAAFLAAPTVVSASNDHGSVHSSAAHAQNHGSHVTPTPHFRSSTRLGHTSGSTTKTTAQPAGHVKHQHNTAGSGPVAATHVSSAPAARAPTPLQVTIRSGFVSATAVTAPSHPTSRSTTAPRALKPGAAPRAATPPSPSTAPVVIGSGGVVGPAPLRIATASNWAPLVVVLLLLCLVVLALVLTSRRRRRVDFPPPPVGGHF